MSCEREANTFESAIIFGAPRGLGNGKSNWEFFTAASEFISGPRMLGCRGVCSTFLCFDGLMFRPLLRHMQARSEIFYATHGQRMFAEAMTEMRCLDYTLGTRCVAHIGSNAIQHAASPFTTDEILASCWVLNDAYRKNSAALLGKLDEWLPTVVAFDAQPPNEWCARQVWSALGVNAKMIELFIHVNPQWRNHRLMVNPKLQHLPNCMELLSVCVVYCLRWRNRMRGTQPTGT